MLRRAISATQAVLGVTGRRRTLPTDDNHTKTLENVSRETLEQLDAYVGLIQKWTKSISLISKGDYEIIWSRHVLDSLRLMPLIPQDATRGIDLGSGAGFPGIILALVTGLPFDLIEADQRKAAFLIEAQRVTGAPVQIHCARIEDLRLPPGALVTARALAPLTTLLAYAHPLLLPEGVALFPKGARATQEIAEARRHWRMRVNRFDDPQQPESTILAITDLTHA